jgi:SAM-dependent methyltransferase
MSDWVEWLDRYDDPTSLQAQRLPVVRELIGQAIAEHPGNVLRALSLCAGDGRDLLPVIVEWRGRKKIVARLVELTPGMAERARAFAAQHELDVDVLEGDAADPANYEGAAPADVVLACGLLGRIPDTHAHRMIGTLPALCRDGGFVVWTRHRHEPDLTPSVRRWFAEAGFEERAFESPGTDNFAVGIHRKAEPIFQFVT